MSSINAHRWQIHRRHFLRGMGVSLALPLLDAMIVPRRLTADEATESVRRFVCIANPFGMIADAFFPSETGPAAALPANLQPLEPHRGRFTVFANLDHGIGGGHAGTHAFLSGVRAVEAAGMPNGNITLDQFLGEQMAGTTRFPVLNTSAGTNSGGCELSWTRSGVLVPSIQRVSKVFQMLFVDDPAELAQRRSAWYGRQGSILDAVGEQARAINDRLGQRDRKTLDQYFTSIREVERTIQQEDQWLSRPRPKVDMKEPKDGPPSKQLPILFDLVTLALQTDSTRVATIEIPGSFDPGGIGLEDKGYHGYSHHGKDPKLMAGMRAIELYQMQELSRFMTKLTELELLDGTQILFGSGMGDGSAHTNRNLPVIVAGGGYRHQTQLVLPEEQSKRLPLSNLYLTMAQRFGVETDWFGHSTGTLAQFS